MLKMTLGQGPLSQKQIELVRVLIQDDCNVLVYFLKNLAFSNQALKLNFSYFKILI